METSSAVLANALAAPDLAALKAAHDVPAAPPELQSRRAILEKAFDEDRDFLLRVIEKYVAHPGIALSWQEKREMALDVYTELFVEAMKTLEKFDPKRSPRPWLLGLANNVVLRKKQERSNDFKRAAQNVQIKSDDEASDAEFFDRLTAASRQYHELDSPLEKQAALDEILCNVSETEREILLLSIVYSLQSESVGAQLGISAAAARKRLQRALENLRADYFKRLALQNSVTETL